jgi:hypothetical protein
MTSVNLNYNNGLFNQDAFDYECFFDQQIEIPPNSKVALYQAELSKQPITISEDQEMSLFYDSSQDSSKAFVLHNSNVALVNDNSLTSIDFTISKNNYSKREFLDHVQTQAQTAINTHNSTVGNPRFPYRMIQQNNNKDIFLGLAPDFTYSDTIVEISEDAADFRQQNMTYNEGSNVASAVDLYPTAPADSAGFGSHAMCQSGINPLSMIKLYDKESMYTVQNTLFWSFVDKSGTGTAHKFGVTFASTSQIKAEQAGGKLGSFTDDGGVTVPLGQIVFQFVNDATNGEGSIDIYVDQELPVNTSNSEIKPENMFKVAGYRCSDLEFNNRFGFQIYYENGVNPNQVTGNKFYFRFLGFAINTAEDTNGFADFLEANENVLYDSKQDNITIGTSIISQMFKYETDGAQSLVGQYYSGLVPCFYMSDLTGTDSSNYAVTSIRGNFIYDDTQIGSGVTNRDVIGLLKYSILGASDNDDPTEPLPDDLRDIFSKDQIVNINPNGWDRFKNNNYGIDELFGNTTNYEIRIPNLPLQAYTSTTDGNVGGKVPTIFTLNNHFSGNLTEVNSGSLIRSIYPPSLKYLALRNDRPLNLNSLIVKIVKSGTNKPADEIQDAKIELLFN